VTPSVDVVIPTHNGWHLTKKCLERLQAQTTGHTVIVVDNASADGTPNNVRSRFEGVRVVKLDSNRGFSSACNAGVRAGTGDVVVLLNNDVECRPDFLERLVAPLREDERLGSVSALLLTPSERIDSFGLVADSTLAGYPRLQGMPPATARSAASIPVEPAGAAGAYRRAAWEEVGGLDENVFSYGEDLDLALRLRAAGWSTAAVPDAVAVHIGSASAGRRSSWQRYQGGFARGYFLQRYGVLRRRSAARALLTEAIAVLGDGLVFSHDLAALRGRLAGWRAARGLPRKPEPPRDAVDGRITFTKSLRLRLDVYRNDR
jgi:N-acetylglucosaminyl-diphospho-decaprenol L-rhamnosyltransferase